MFVKFDTSVRYIRADVQMSQSKRAMLRRCSYVPLCTRHCHACTAKTLTVAAKTMICVRQPGTPLPVAMLTARSSSLRPRTSRFSPSPTRQRLCQRGHRQRPRRLPHQRLLCPWLLHWGCTQYCCRSSVCLQTTHVFDWCCVHVRCILCTNIHVCDFISMTFVGINRVPPTRLRIL